MKLKRTIAGAALLVTAFLITGCSSNSNETASHNQQDIDFAKGMIPHHGQAVEMADLAESRSSNAELKTLAAQIKAAQAPEIEQMNAWLRSWGEPEQNAKGSAMEGMDHGEHASHAMNGMMSTDYMTRLASTSGEQFDRMFLEGMIEHHKGAIEMAKTEQSKGKSAEAKALADTIIATQQTEIDAMNRLLG